MNRGRWFVELKYSQSRCLAFKTAVVLLIRGRGGPRLTLTHRFLFHRYTISPTRTLFGNRKRRDNPFPLTPVDGSDRPCVD